MATKRAWVYVKININLSEKEPHTQRGQSHNVPKWNVAALFVLKWKGEQSKMSEKDAKFKKGNEIGIETRFKPGNTLSKKYKSEYADSLLRYFLTCDKLPTIEEWAVQNQLAVRTVYDWTTDEKKYPRFAATYAQAKAIQKTKLVQNGLKEVYNATLVKFLLINNHGMSDKTLNDTNVTFSVDYSSNEIDEESN